MQGFNYMDWTHNLVTQQSQSLVFATWLSSQLISVNLQQFFLEPYNFDYYTKDINGNAKVL